MGSYECRGPEEYFGGLHMRSGVLGLAKTIDPWLPFDWLQPSWLLGSRV